jgi:copper chaperone
MILDKTLFGIVGMCCVSCKSVVGKQLKREREIKKISLDYITYSVIVEFDPVLITKKNKFKKN